MNLPAIEFQKALLREFEKTALKFYIDILNFALQLQFLFQFQSPADLNKFRLERVQFRFRQRTTRAFFQAKSCHRAKCRS